MRQLIACSAYALALTLGSLLPAVCDAAPCWRYTASEACTSYPLTDFSIGRAVPGAQGSPTREIDFSSSLGWLFVVNERFHAGPALLFGLYLDGGWHSQMGVQARLRYLATPSIHLDLTPALILIDSPYPGGFAGYSIELACGWRDWVSVASRLDIVDEGLHGSQTVAQIGIRLGSYPGLGLSAAGAIAGGLGYVRSQMD